MLEHVIEVLAVVGFTFIVTGVIMYKFPPKKINMIYGYKTCKSMKNKKNWDFAQKYSAKLLTILGIILILLSTLNIFFKVQEKTKMIVSGLLIIVSIFIILYKTENKLKDL